MRNYKNRQIRHLCGLRGNLFLALVLAWAACCRCAHAQQTINYSDGEDNTGTITITGSTNPTTLSTVTGDATQSGVISESGTTGSIIITGSGTLTLDGSNTFTGGVNLDAGVLSLGSSNALGTQGIIAFNGGTLQYTANNTNDYSSRFSTASNQAFNIDTNDQSITFQSSFGSGSSLSVFGGGNLVLENIDHFNSITVGAATTLTPVIFGAFQSTTTLTLQNGTVNLAGTLQSLSDVTVQGGTLENGTLSASSITFSSSLPALVSAVLEGSTVININGMVTFTAPNTYTGGTVVSSGTFVVSNTSGSATGTGSFTLNHGATLSGTGTISSSAAGGTNLIQGNVLVGNGGTTDVLTMKASAATNFSGASLTFNLGTGGGGTTLGKSSQLALESTPSVVFDGTNGMTLTLNLVGGTAVADGTQYILFTSTDSTSPFTFIGNISLSGSNVISGSGLNLVINSSQGAGYYNGSHLEVVDNGGVYDIVVNVQAQVVPEPSTWALIFGGLVLFGAYRKNLNSPKRSNLRNR